MAKVLLTGATGYIGSGLVTKLELAGCSVLCLVRPASLNRAVQQLGDARCIAIPESQGELAALVSNVKPDAVMHLASRVLTSHTPDQATELVESNIAFPSRLLEAMKSAGIRHFLNTGTFFQSAAGVPGTPFNLYAATKQAFEDVLQHYVRNEGFCAITLRLADTFGIGDTRRKIVQLLVDAAVREEALALSLGEQKISLTWVDDVRSGFVQGLERLLGAKDAGHEVFGLCNPELVTIRDLGRLVEAAIGHSVDFQWGKRPYRQGEIMIPVLPPNLPGWEIKVNIENGINCLVAQQLNNSKNANIS